MTNLVQLSKEWHLATALYDAIDDENLREVAILIQEKHANPNVIIPDYGVTPFHLAVGHENERFAKEITKLILKNGGNPNIIGTDGITPLHVAAAWNRSIIVRLLLSYGADPFVVDDTEKNAFHYAYDEHAWETLKTLEIHRRTQHVKSDEDEKNYDIRLDKVIIHSNDVQAEYRALYNAGVIETPSKQNVSTQTPFPFSRIQVRREENEFFVDRENNYINGDRDTFDMCYDWCEQVSNVMITDNCKRKILSHRTKSSVYEYSPKTVKSVECYASKPVTDNKRRFFPVSCCFDQNDYITDDSESKDGSCNTVREKEMKEKNRDQNRNCVKTLQTPSNNLVSQRDTKFCYTSDLFSEESSISEDQDSECKPMKRNSFFNDVDNIPFIDESVSGSSLNVDHPSQKEEKCVMNKTKYECDKVSDEKKNEASAVVLKKDLKHAEWSGCLSKCACIPSVYSSNSLMAECTGADQEKETRNEYNSVRSINVLPSTTSVDKSNFEKRKNVDDSLIPSKDIGDEDNDRQRTGNVSVELKYTDDEDGIEFIEARLPFSSSSKRIDNTKQKNRKQESGTDSVQDMETSDPNAYDTDYIRRELRKLGFVSGPIAGAPTKKLYLRKLRRIKKTLSSPVAHLMKPSFSSELEQVLNNKDNWIKTLTEWSTLETDIREHFLDSSFSSTWRTGSAKTSFTYLLLDPRISNNLPARCEEMDLIEVWRTFVHAIFYIGKGTRARPYEHLHEAFLIWHETRAYMKRYCNLKVKQILDIWKDGLGVVCVQAFHNLIPAEAHTREAAMIDAVGVARLKNEKCGIYYGIAASWNSKLKRRFGAFLLYRAMKIFIAENEIQLKPADVN